MVRSRRLALIVLGLAGPVLVAFSGTAWRPLTADGADPTPVPTTDPLAVPVMPDSPTQLDAGRNAYYYHCMPCHGDHGQGLTEEWRQVWVPDHQDCWARGCHAGRDGDDGFPIPRSVPPVGDSPSVTARFGSQDDLFQFLTDQHPPQRPGALEENERWAVTALILDWNGLLPAGGIAGPGGADKTAARVGAAASVIGASLVMLLLALFARRHVSR